MLVKYLIFVVCLLNSYSLQGSDSLNNVIETQTQKFKTILETIKENYYRDSIDFVKVSESAFIAFLKELDPYSTYFTSEQYESLKEGYIGSIYGVGIRLFRRVDSILVFTVKKGSPADSAGIRVGDRVIYINHEYVVGKDINFANSMLHCKSGDSILVTIKRGNSLSEYKLPCKELELPSLVAKLYYPQFKTAFIRFVRFGSNTYSEFITALDSLIQLGANFLIVDIRGNQGGYLESAVKLSGLFLNKGDTILTVQARKDGNKVYIAEETGKYSKLPLVVLIDGSSASASEIFASALQDNSRAVIAGERSFGKGLVQKVWEFRDGSAFRITTGEFLSPLGRSIQKNPNLKDFDPSLLADLNIDSVVKQNVFEFLKRFGTTNRLPTYFTKSGRLVLGGGGIFPDVFFRADTIPPYLQRLKNSGFVNDFVLRHFIDNKSNFPKLKNFSLNSFVANFKIKESDILSFKKYIFDWKSLDEVKFENEKKDIEIELKATLAYIFWDDLGYSTSFLFDNPSLISKLFELKTIATNLVN